MSGPRGRQAAVALAVVAVAALAVGAGQVLGGREDARNATGPSASASSPPSPAPPTVAASPEPTPRATVSPTWHPVPAEDDPETGTSSGSGAVARDPHEVLALVVPLGCEQRSRLPVPVRALEETFEEPVHMTPAVVLTLQFGSSAAALRFMELRRSDLAACSRQGRDPISSAAAPVTGLVSLSPTTVVSVRTEPFVSPARASWTEVARGTGSSVTLTAFNLGPKELAPKAAEALAQRLVPAG